MEALVVVMVCTGIVFVLPEVVKPVIPDVAVAVQVNVVPTGLAVKLTNVVCEPEHIV